MDNRVRAGGTRTAGGDGENGGFCSTCVFGSQFVPRGIDRNLLD